MVIAPTSAFVVLSLSSWFGHRPSERAAATWVGMGLSVATMAGFVLLVFMAVPERTEVQSPILSWFTVGHYHFTWRLVADRLSLPVALFSVILVGVVGVFSRRYLHRERGFVRFYVMLALFGAAVQLVVLAGSLDLIFFGWELVGLSSTLLIAYFHDRVKPVEHGLRAYISYRVCDIGLLAALVWLHHTVGSTDATPHMETPWDGFPVPPKTFDCTLVALLLVWATLGKSAQLPFSGWLPRAMEGPTPSSAIFYGAISVHLGPYLLLRAAPILVHAPIAAAFIVVIGASTALHATFVGRVQTDVKSALAYASMTQIGVIFVEIGLGLYWIAIIHIVGHACLRSLQILRAPNALKEHQLIQQSLASAVPATGTHFERWIPRPLQTRLYRHALDRGLVDVVLLDSMLTPIVRGLRALDQVDALWIRQIAGESEARRASGGSPVSSGAPESLS